MLDNKVRNLEWFSAFIKHILRFIRPSTDSTFNVHNLYGNQLLTRLLVWLNHLRDLNQNDASVTEYITTTKIFKALLLQIVLI